MQLRIPTRCSRREHQTRKSEHPAQRLRYRGWRLPALLLDLGSSAFANLPRSVLCSIEADRMLDMGLHPTTFADHKWLPPECRTDWFSATYSSEKRGKEGGYWLRWGGEVGGSAHLPSFLSGTARISPSSQVASAQCGPLNWSTTLVIECKSNKAHLLVPNLIQEDNGFRY